MNWIRSINPADKPKYLLLFGHTTFNYINRINNNTNLVPAYQSNISLDPLSTYTSDDFFGFLNDNEDINSGLITNLLDIAIGRIPAKNLEEAKNYFGLSIINLVRICWFGYKFTPWQDG